MDNLLKARTLPLGPVSLPASQGTSTGHTSIDQGRSPGPGFEQCEEAPGGTRNCSISQLSPAKSTHAPSCEVMAVGVLSGASSGCVRCSLPLVRRCTFLARAATSQMSRTVVYRPTNLGNAGGHSTRRISTPVAPRDAALSRPNSKSNPHRRDADWAQKECCFTLHFHTVSHTGIFPHSKIPVKHPSSA